MIKENSIEVKLEMGSILRRNVVWDTKKERGNIYTTFGGLDPHGLKTAEIRIIDDGDNDELFELTDIFGHNTYLEGPDNPTNIVRLFAALNQSWREALN